MRTITLYSLMLVLLAAIFILLSRIIDMNMPREEGRVAATNTYSNIGSAMPRIAIVIDDCGGKRSYEEQFLSLSPDIVFAILPEGSYAARFAGTLAEKGFEYILHMPMEPHDVNEIRGMISLSVGDNAKAIEHALKNALAVVPGARGMNNHTGSRFTEDRALLIPVANFCKERGIYFFDSRTSIKSAAYDVMREKHVRTARRDIFLDDTRSVRAIRERFLALIATAQRRGSAVAIGHYTSEKTRAVLAEEIPLLAKHGVRLVRLSELVQ